MQQNKFRSGHRSCGAFTMVEVLIVVGVMVILAGLLVGNYGRIIQTVQKAQCMSHLRSLHSVFSTYTNDFKVWPQPPDFPADQDRAYEEWWVTTMEPYGTTAKMWTCPTIARAEQMLPPRDRNKVHYTPTEFDDNPGTPWRWPTMPWFTEIANAHGHGALIIFTDGSIRPSEDFF
jgi:type II secretory pathway pseudopilin PulG